MTDSVELAGAFRALARPATIATGEEIGRGSRDDLPRMDAELMAAGIHPGHPSLYDDPDTAGEGRGAQGAP